MATSPFKKFAGELSSDSCGRRMPPLDPDYFFDRNAGELTRIRSWILAGALND